MAERRFVMAERIIFANGSYSRRAPMSSLPATNTKRLRKDAKRRSNLERKTKATRGEAQLAGTRVIARTRASAVSSAPSTHPWLAENASPTMYNSAPGNGAAIFFMTSQLFTP
jgi:hypothetical protein